MWKGFNLLIDKHDSLDVALPHVASSHCITAPLFHVQVSPSTWAEQNFPTVGLLPCPFEGPAGDCFAAVPCGEQQAVLGLETKWLVFLY